MKTKALLTFCLFLISSTAMSAQYTMLTNWRYGPPHQWSWFPLSFTYDDAVADSNSSTGVGVFNNSVRDLHFTYEGEDWSLDGSQPNSITLYTAHPPTMNTFQLRAGTINEAGEQMEISISVESGWFSQDSLSVLRDEIFNSYSQLYFRQNNVSTKIAEGSGAFVVTPVPLPAGVYLMSSGLLALVGARRLSNRRAGARSSVPE
jgi:hypothetical protein